MTELEQFDATFAARPEAIDGVSLTMDLDGSPYAIQPGEPILLENKASGHAYRVAGGRCNCPDAIYRRHECKHVKALRVLGLL